MHRVALVTLSGLLLGACSGEPGEDTPTQNAELAEGEERAGPARANFGDGMITRSSNGSVGETVTRLEQAIETEGFTVVAKLDHRVNAENVEIDLTPATVILFGKPVAGSVLIEAAPSAALDLPQRMAVYQDKEGAVVIAYNDPAYLATRHNITGQDERMAEMAAALSKLASLAAGEEPEAVDNGTNEDTEEQD